MYRIRALTTLWMPVVAVAIGTFGLAISASTALASHCGGKNESACDCFTGHRCCFCGDSACNGSLKEINVPTCGAANAPDCEGVAISWCAESTRCGHDGERACCSSSTLSNGKSCVDGLIEDLTDEGRCVNKLDPEDCACEGGTWLSLGTCRDKKGVGESCNLITPCEDGLLCRLIGPFESICMADLDDAVSPEECLTFFDLDTLERAVTTTPLNGDQGETLNYGLGVSGAIGATVSVSRGVVYGRDGCFACYETQCSGLELAVGYAGMAELGRSNTPLLCPEAMVCDGDRGTTCTDNAGCAAEDFCASYICTNDATQSCATDADCTGSGTCRRCNTFDGEGWVLYTTFGTGVKVLSVTESLSFANCPPLEDILDPDLEDICELVGSGESISIGFGISFPISIGFADCTTVETVVGCLDSSGNFIEDVSNQPPSCSFTVSPSLSATCSTQTSPSFSLASTSVDPEGGSLTYQWTSSCPGNSFTDATSATTSMTVGWPMCQIPCFVTLRVSDGANSVICTPQIVNYVDQAKPVISPGASSLTVECDGSGNATALSNWGNSHGGASATDACGSVTWTDNVSALSNGCGATGSANGTFTATDDCDNNSATSATFTIEDTTSPTVTCPSNATLECPANTSIGANGSATGSDTCGGVTITSSDVSVAGCGNTETITRTWKSTDDCGLNSPSCDQIIEVVDTTPPSITCPVDVIITWGDSTDPDDTGTATSTDDCDSAPEITHGDVVVATTCPADPVQEVISRTWTATDDCDLEDSCVQTITVLKKVFPLDIKPGSCPNSYNRGSHGVLPLGLLGTADFDVSSVVLSSVVISRADCIGGAVAPHEGPPGPHSEFSDVGTSFPGALCDCHELTGDGITDLSMKFKTDNVVSALQLDDFSAGALVKLVVSGTLADGCKFIAADCVRLVPPGTPPGLLAVLQPNVAEAYIEVTPLDDQLDSGGFGNFDRTFPQSTVSTLEAPNAAGEKQFVGWKLDGIFETPDFTFGITVEGMSQTIEAVYRLPGDIVADDTVNLVDFAQFANCYRQNAGAANCAAEFHAASDLNRDGVIDLRDFAIFAVHFGT